MAALARLHRSACCTPWKQSRCAHIQHMQGLFEIPGGGGVHPPPAGHTSTCHCPVGKWLDMTAARRSCAGRPGVDSPRCCRRSSPSCDMLLHCIAAAERQPTCAAQAAEAQLPAVLAWHSGYGVVSAHARRSSVSLRAWQQQRCCSSCSAKAARQPSKPCMQVCLLVCAALKTSGSSSRDVPAHDCRSRCCCCPETAAAASTCPCGVAMP